MPSYDQLPGVLNLSFLRGNDFAVLVDLSIPITGYAVTASLTSLVTGQEVQPFTVAVVSAEDGQISVTMTDAQTAVLPHGTYGWNLRWVEGANTKTALAGLVEVK